MNTNRFIRPQHAHCRSRVVDFRTIFAAGAMVFTGLLLAALYCLLTNQIRV